MTFDERIDRLTERHEALTQNVELMALQNQETGRAIAELRHSMKDFSQIVRQSAASIDTLARIAELHEHRLGRLEGA